MTLLQVAFLLIGAFTLVAAVLVVSSRKIMHAAMWLIVALGGVAAIFATLEAGFFTAIQVAVYVGAIAILIIFAVMLTRRSLEDIGPQNNRNWPIGLVAVVGVFAGLLFLFAQWPGITTLGRPLPVGGENLVEFGKALVSTDGYVLPFEVASILLLAALIGAIYVASEPKRK
jgi:NADH-quinone oxidoreductase subunit J